MGKAIGTIIILPNQFNRNTVMQEILKFKRNKYFFLYCSGPVFQTLQSAYSPYEQKARAIIGGLQVEMMEDLYDNILLFSKVGIKMNKMPCADNMYVCNVNQLPNQCCGGTENGIIK